MYHSFSLIILTCIVMLAPQGHTYNDAHRASSSSSNDSGGGDAKLALTGGSGQSCTGVNGCESSSPVVQLKAVTKKGTQSCIKKEQMNKQFADELNKALAACTKEMKCAGKSSIGSMGVGRSKSASGGGGRSGNSCHKTRRAIDIGSFECNGHEMSVAKGSKKSNNHSKFFRTLESCLKKNGNLKTVLYDGGAHEDHLHVEIGGCKSQNNSSGSQCSPGGMAAQERFHHSLKHYVFFYGLLTSSSVANATDSINPLPQNLMKVKSKKWGLLKVSQTDWGEPADFPYEVKLTWKCNSGKKHTLFNKKVCHFDDQGFNRKNGKVWVTYSMATRTPDGFSRCGEAHYASFELSANCSIKKQHQRILGATEKHPIY